MMNELVRRMASVGISKTVTRGNFSRVAGAQGQRLFSVTSSSSSRPVWLPSVQPQQRLRFSTTVSTNTDTTALDGIVEVSAKDKVLSPTKATVVTDATSGKQFGMLLDTRKLPKLKPGIVKRRLANCKTYLGTEKMIRQSPWKLNRICQLAAGLTLEEALTQLKFCSLKNADLVAKRLKITSNLSDIRDGLQISQLEVAECFTTKAMMLRRVKPMGRGRYVRTHIRCVYYLLLETMLICSAISYRTCTQTLTCIILLLFCYREDMVSCTTNFLISESF
jgi:large subunit ribosomal protein L22